jgi:hypothetical protein
MNLHCGSPCDSDTFISFCSAFCLFIFSCSPLMVLRIEPRALHKLDKHSTTTFSVPFCTFWRCFFFLLLLPFVRLGFNSGLHVCKAGALTLEPTPPVHFVLVIWRWRVSWTISLGWPSTVILSILSSQVARITGMSHRCPATLYF